MAHLPFQDILCLESVHAQDLSAGAAEEGPLRALCIALRLRNLSPLQPLSLFTPTGWREPGRPHGRVPIWEQGAGGAGNLRERAERTCALSCRNSTASPFVWRKAVHVKASPPLFLPSPLSQTQPAAAAIKRRKWFVAEAFVQEVACRVMQAEVDAALPPELLRQPVMPLVALHGAADIHAALP